MRQLLGWNGSRGEMGRGGWVGFQASKKSYCDFIGDQSLSGEAVSGGEWDLDKNIDCSVEGFAQLIGDEKKLAMWLVQEFKNCVYSERRYSLGYKLTICVMK